MRWSVDGPPCDSVQRTKTFTGIEGITNQDRAVQENMGAIAERWRETLGTTDRAIIDMRKLLLEELRAVEDGGEPLGCHEEYYGIHPAGGVLRLDQPWRELKPQMYVS